MYDQDTRRSKLKPGQRVPVRITVPAGDTWQLWITGGPAPVAITVGPAATAQAKAPAVPNRTRAAAQRPVSNAFS